MPDESLTAGFAAAALDALTDPVFVSDRDGRVRYYNDAAAQTTGRSADALDGVTLADLFDDITVDRVFAAADADRDETGGHASLLTAHGDRIPVDIDASRLATDTDHVVVTAHVVPSGRQPTHGSDVIDRMTDAFFAVDQDWRFTYVNDQAAELIVDAMAEDPDGGLAGRSLWDAVPDAVGTRFHEEYRRAMETQEPVNFEEYYEPLDVWLAVRAYPSASGLSVFFRDVTDRRRHEEALEEHARVLREMHDVTADTDRSFTEQVDALLDLGLEVLDTSSGAFSRIEGDDYLFEVVRGLTDTEPGDVVPVSATNCEITASERQTLVMANIARDAPELTEKQGYAEWGISCYLGAPVFVEGEVYGTFCFYDETPRTDPFTEWEVTLVDMMSQWVGYELTRRRVRERLEAKNEQLDRFASIVSHDLRNPLNVLDGYLDLAEETGDPSHLEQCRRTVDQMEQLVDDLLSLARAGQVVDDVEPIGLATVAREAWASVESGDATFDVDGDVTVLADESRLRQLLTNLFRNSIDHGGSDVAVTVDAFDSGFSVADDGPGIPERDREVVFDAGYSTSEDGTGFGLSIVAEIAEAHGWTVDVTDSEGGGARFDFRGVAFA